MTIQAQARRADGVVIGFAVQWGKANERKRRQGVRSDSAGLGLKTLNAQFLPSYALMFGLAACASVALYLSMSISPETINVAGAQRMLSQKMAREALQLRLGAGDPKALAATIAQYERSAADLDAGNAERNVSRMGAPEIAAQRQKVAQIWGRYRAMLDTACQPGRPARLSQYSTELLGELNKLVSLMSARADSVQHPDVDRLRLPVGDPGAGGARPAVRPGAADAAVARVGGGADRGRCG